MSLTQLNEIDLSKLKVLEADSLTLIVYLPLDRTNLEVNRIRLKNAVAEVKALVEERYQEASFSKPLTRELEKLISHEAITHATYPGLAVISHMDRPDELTIHPLWHRPEPRVSLAESPHVTPLLRNGSHQAVTLLCLADNALRLFRGHFGELHEQKLPPDVPHSLSEVMRFEQQAGLDGNEFYRNKGKMPGGGSSHGEGPTGGIEAEFERRYFRKIGQALLAVLNPGEKLLLAGVKEKLDWFREENPALAYLPNELHGNFERASNEELLHRADQCLAETERAQLRQELEKAHELSPERRLDRKDEIVEAARQARVETLYLSDSSLPEKEREALVLTVLRGSGRVKLVDDPESEPIMLATLRW